MDELFGVTHTNNTKEHPDDTPSTPTEKSEEVRIEKTA
jgi:hypothetical protein